MRFGAAALTLAVGLGVVGMAPAQESGNWFTNLFTGGKNDPARRIDLKDVTPIPPSTVNNRAIKAKADLDRRQEVCMKLREIALATGDDDLMRKADMLDQRAFDLYLAAKNQPASVDRSMSAVDAKKGGR